MYTFLNNGVTAHRGNSDDWPQNTLPAFQSGIELGADWLELDAHLTKDDELVVIHDGNTKSVGDRTVVVAEATYDELRQVDAATKFRAAKGLSLEQCPKGTVPRLAEVIQLVKAQDKTRVSIQPKADCVDEIMALLHDMDALDWAGFNDGDLRKMQRVKTLAPAVPVFWDRGPDNDIASDVETALAAGFESIVIHYSGLTQAKVDAIHAAGLQAGAWTVNDAETMARLLGLGADRLYTDCPKRLLEIQKGLAR